MGEWEKGRKERDGGGGGGGGGAGMSWQVLACHALRALLGH